MKKISTVLILAMIALLCFAGCQNSLPNEEKSTVARPALESSSSTEAPSETKSEEATTDIINNDTECRTEEGTEDLIINDPALNGEFLFEYSIYSMSGEKGNLFARGDKIKVVTKVTNVGKDHVYEGAETDYRANLAIYCDSLAGGNIYFEMEPIESTTDYMTHYINSGESREATYYLTVPDDAPATWYKVHLSYGGDSRIVEQGVRVFDTTDLSYERSPVLISSGGNSIRPLSFISYIEECDENGEIYFTEPVDYWGYYRIYYMLRDGEITSEQMPALILSRDFAVTHMPIEHQIKNEIHIRTLTSNQNIYSGEISGLFELPEGEYLAIMTHQFDEPEKTFTGEEGHYLIYGYDMVFRLVVSDSSELELPLPEYSYSQTEIRSGENKINPISCFCYGTWYDADGNATVHADGYGVYWVFEVEENPDPKYFPILVRDGEVGVYSTPVNSYISGSIRLFGLDFQPLDYSGGWEGLAELPAGDYLVVYVEEYDGRGCDPEPREYSITVDECMFRLIVTE